MFIQERAKRLNAPHQHDVPMSAADYWKSFKEKGAKFTIGTLIAALIFGIIDSLTAGLIPYMAEEIRYLYNPPRFYINFSRSLLTDGKPVDAVLYDLSSQSETKIREEIDYLLTVKARPGSYAIKLTRPNPVPTEEIYAPLKVNKSEDIVQVDTSPGKWVSLDALRKPFPSNEPDAVQREATRLMNTRWSVSQIDLTAAEGLSDKTSIALISAALSEVGTFDKGTETERARIKDYWKATQPGSDKNLATDQPDLPWGGAFLAWVVRKAGASPPQGSPAFRSWLDWGQPVPVDQLKPGMMVIFKLTGNAVPQATSRLLIGVALKQRGTCIDVVTGNIVDRVVITCVSAPVIAIRKAEAANDGPR